MVLFCLEGVAQKVSDPRFSHFVASPLPVINDQSLSNQTRLRTSMTLITGRQVLGGHLDCSVLI